MVGCKIIFLSIILLFNTVHEVKMKKECIKGLTTPGYTEPSGDIIIKHGNPLDITCVLNEEYLELNPNVTSQDLFFERGDGMILPKDLVTVVNSSSIHLHMDLPEISSWVYNCKLKNRGGVCLNTVQVGEAPVLVDDLNCAGFNYESLTCFWTAATHTIPTTYDVRYLTHNGESGNCPNLLKLASNRMCCIWTLTSLPTYRRDLQNMNFKLTVSNQLGTDHYSQNFSHFAHVVPAAVENVTCINSTSNSTVVSWSIPDPMQAFPPGLYHQVTYKSEFDSKWQLATVLYSDVQNETNQMTYELANLTYAFSTYEISIAIRSAMSDRDDVTMWSKPVNITMRTKGKIPDRPPATTHGSFESLRTGNAPHHQRDVYVYWQHISEKHRNGKNFRYEVETGHKKPVEITNAYAKFLNLSLDEEYVFEIWSVNNFGRSGNSSKVWVPKDTYGYVGPAHLTKLIRDNHSYELSWDSLNYPVSNFTIFACMYDRDRPYQCAGNLFWKVIPPNKDSYVVKPPEPKKIYQFAVSANSEEFTSGMVWAECSVLSSQVTNHLKNVWISQVGSTFVILNWKLDCSERTGKVNGFLIHYCSYTHFSHNVCEWSETSFDGITTEQGNVTGLLPYTKYVFVLTKLAKNAQLLQKSVYLFATTNEAAPTPPTNLKVLDVSNSSVRISWSAPSVPNGKISHYVILGKNHIFKVNASEREFTVTHLDSYTPYNFTLFACTVACSKPSLPLHVKTHGGFPGIIGQPGVTFQNDTITLVEWDRPKVPNGDCDIYEVRFKEKRLYDNKTLNIINTTEKFHVVEDCGNGGRYNTFFISVRAVNIFNDSRLEGPWSDELQSFCRHVSSYVWVWAIAPSVVVVALLIYLGRRMYYNYQKMRDIEVRLPPGLEVFVFAPLPERQEVPHNDNKQVPIRLSKCSQNPPEGVFKKESKGDCVCEHHAADGMLQHEEVRYVQVGDNVPREKRNSVIVVANNVTINTGYVTVADMMSGKRT